MFSIDLNSELVLSDGNYLVAAFHGSMLRLRHCLTGDYSTVHIGSINDRLLEPPTRGVVDPRVLETIGDKANEELTRYAAHIEEMATGRQIDPGLPPRPEYDPAVTTLNSRIASKVSEMKSLGLVASRATLIRKKKEYDTGGVAALVDGRSLRKEGPLDRADADLLEALIHVISLETYQSTGTTTRLFSRLDEELKSRHPGRVFDMPSQTTLRRYCKFLTKGKYTTGSAPTRRTAANTPKRPFGTARRMRPGQEVQIDSSPWDVMVRSDDGKPIRAHLTIMVDVATRSIIGTSVRTVAPKGIDHAFLLAQALVPRSLRPGHDELRQQTARRMPWGTLVPDDERERLDLTRPFIFPERIMMDNGADYRSKVFESACRKFGVSLTFSAPHTPTDKAIVERTFESIKTLFAQHLPGYKGGSVAERGREIEKGTMLDPFTLAELFDEWVVQIWQNRPHDDLRDPIYPALKITPNEMYNASFDLAAQLPLPLTERDYIELMPIETRMILPAGVRYNHRYYDSIELQPFRNQPSNDKSLNNLWEVRVNPYDPRLVWVRHPDNHWIECIWRDETTSQNPHAEAIFENAVQLALSRSDTHPTDLKEIVTGLTKRARTAALTKKQAEDRHRVSLELAEKAGTPMPSITTEHSLIAFDAFNHDDESVELELESLNDTEWTN